MRDQRSDRSSSNRILMGKLVALLVAIFMLTVSFVPGTLAFVMRVTPLLDNIFEVIPPESFKGDFTVYKEIEHPFGDDYKYSDVLSFDFYVELGAEYAGEELETSIGKLKADDKGGFKMRVSPETPFSLKGVEMGTEIKVTELLDGKKGFAAKDGKLSQTLVLSEDDNELTFVNTYVPAPYEGLDLDLFGIKVLDNIVWGEGDSFEYLLEQKVGDKWVKLGGPTLAYDAEREGNGNFNFEDAVKGISIASAGTHSFRVTEIIGDLDETYYDKTVNHFELVIGDADMDGYLEIGDVITHENVSYKYNEETKRQELTVLFDNSFVPAGRPDDIVVTITAKNTIDNRSDTELSADIFEFVLENLESGLLTTLNSAKNGQTNFALTYTADDIGKTYNYKLYQLDNGIDGVIYSDAVYNVSITIGVDEDEKLTAKIVCDEVEYKTLIVEFTTIYDPGRPVEDAEFHPWPLMFTGSIAAATSVAIPVATHFFKKKRGLI